MTRVANKAEHGLWDPTDEATKTSLRELLITIETIIEFLNMQPFWSRLVSDFRKT